MVSLSPRSDPVRRRRKHAPLRAQAQGDEGTILSPDEKVDVTSWESFPASDPPAWIGAKIGPPR